ncbi:autotransporter outer membrane beta-barrel domain-containing protein, partial [Microvirga sp. W0021]
GMDIYRREYADGMRDIAGLYVGYGNIDSNIQQVYGGKAGTMTMDAYSLGAYWTRKGASGWYIDAVAQGTLFDDVKGTSVEGSQMKTNGFAFTASLEGGYPIALGQGWSIEPQAQLIYQYVSLDNSHDNYGRVLYGDTNTLYTRLGARLSKNWELANRYQLTTWARVNLWHAFGGN